MKKISGILVLCLILSGCLSTQEVINSGDLRKGSSKQTVRSAFLMTGLFNDPFISGCFAEYFPSSKTEIIASGAKDIYLIFENVSWPMKGCPGNPSTIGDGTLKNYVPTYAQAQKIAQPKKIVKKTQPKKEKKETNSNNSSGSSGSAFFISSRGDIITNNHVIENCKSQPTIKYKNRDVTANIVATDRMLDLALLKADLRNTKYISFSRDEPRKLQKIIAAGYPFGQYLSDDLKFTSGIVSSLKGPGDDSTLVQVDAALNIGNSGGPIVDESSGQLVAVSVLTMDKSIAEGQNFGIKTSSVKNFLNANKVKVPYGFNFNRDVADSLEKSTLYVYCY